MYCAMHLGTCLARRLSQDVEISADEVLEMRLNDELADSQSVLRC
jgi:hypothetical protein